MNSDNIFPSLQKGFRVTLGATASLIENLQSPQTLEQQFSQLRSDPNQKIEEWAEKGEITEQEARKFLEALFTQPTSASSTSSSGSSNSGSTVGTTSTDANRQDASATQLEIKQLTEQIAAIRAELEKLRETDSRR